MSVLSDIVIEYEKEYFPIEKPTVAELIVSGLSDKKMTQQASLICRCLGIRPAEMLGIFNFQKS